MGAAIDKCCASERERPAQGQAPPDPDGAIVGADEGEQMTPAEKLEVLKRASLTPDIPYDDGKGGGLGPTFTGKPEQTPEPRPVDAIKQENGTSPGEEKPLASPVPQFSGGTPEDAKPEVPSVGGSGEKTINAKVSSISKTSESSNTSEGTRKKAARLLKSGLKTGEVGKLVDEHERAEQVSAVAGATNVKKAEKAQEEDDLFEF